MPGNFTILSSLQAEAEGKVGFLKLTSHGESGARRSSLSFFDRTEFLLRKINSNK